MNILILATWFPPDTAIAAVRPYMLAKYLEQRGHIVTVLRSGEINASVDDFFETLPAGLRVISYLGENSPAEAYARGEWSPAPVQNKSRIAFLPTPIRRPVAKAYHCLMQPVAFSKYMEKTKLHFNRQREALERLKGEGFDVVFSTFGELANVFAGEYAADLFGCKWILDFRDPLLRDSGQGFYAYNALKKIQNHALKRADLCTTVSDGLSDQISLHAGSTPVITIYNGYEPTAILPTFARKTTDESFSICYTGQIYPKHRPALRALFNAFEVLREEGKIDPERVRIEYAGPNGDELLAACQRSGMEKSFHNHGYVRREEAKQLQEESDLFLTLGWNTRTERGGLSGKFYEGIRSQKPILALVAGSVPNCELLEKSYHYRFGFCYECAQEKILFPQLCEYLANAYAQKIESGAVAYDPAPELFTDFRYDTLAVQLESLCMKLVQQK